MKTQTIDIKTPDGMCDTYVACPGDSQYPAVLFLMDVYGPRAYLYEMAQKLASRGYYVLLPNLFYRVRRAPVVDIKFPMKLEDVPEVMKVIMPLFQKFSHEAGVRDGGVFLEYLAKEDQVRPGKVGLTGYCLGGSIAMRIAAHYPNRIAAAASFHGGNLASEAPDSPHLLLPEIKCELYIAYAETDKSMPAEQVERLDAALKKSHVRYETEVYKGTHHGFTMADLPAYNKDGVDRHWEKLFALFDRTLINPGH